VLPTKSVKISQARKRNWLLRSLPPIIFLSLINFSHSVFIALVARMKETCLTVSSLNFLRTCILANTKHNPPRATFVILGVTFYSEDSARVMGFYINEFELLFRHRLIKRDSCSQDGWDNRDDVLTNSSLNEWGCNKTTSHQPHSFVTLFWTDSITFNTTFHEEYISVLSIGFGLLKHRKFAWIYPISKPQNLFIGHRTHH